jgi:uncharacterized UBP type Zn finger protein
MGITFDARPAAPTDALAHPTPEHTPWQAGLKPAGFKALVGRGHAEFSTMRQQDAEEFFSHFLTVLRRFNHQNTRGVPGTRGLSHLSLALIIHKRI